MRAEDDDELDREFISLGPRPRIGYCMVLEIEEKVVGIRVNRSFSKANSYRLDTCFFDHCCIFSVASWRLEHPGESTWFRPDMTDHLGAEHDSIANSIVAGRGFSDPFRAKTRPTAWMPPVLPYFTALLYVIAGGDRSIVVEIVVYINAVVVYFFSLVFIREAKRVHRAVLGYVILVIGLSANFFQLFQFTHDTWLLLLVFTLLFVGVQRVWTAPRSIVAALSWGLFGGLSALCSPVAGGVWAAVTTIRWISKPREAGSPESENLNRRMKMLLLSAITSMVVVAPWTIRNRLVMGKWTPLNQI